MYGAKLWALYPPMLGNWRRSGVGGAVMSDLAKTRPEFMAKLFEGVGTENDEGGAANATGSAGDEGRGTRVTLAPLATPRLCIQRAGEVLFVPTGWAHATVNLAGSIGVAVEVGDRAELASAGGPH